MRTLLAIILLLTPFVLYAAANTHSTDVERSSSQYWVDTTATGGTIEDNTDVTIDAMIKLESMPNAAPDHMGIASLGSAAALDWMLRILTTDEIYCSVNEQGVGLSQWRTDKIGSDWVSAWHRVTCAVDISVPSATIYIDGVATTTTTVESLANSRTSTNDDFYVGRDISGASRYFDGLIDEVAVYDAVVTPSNICTRTASDTNLVGWWKFDNDGNDTHANANHLTNTNSATFSSDVSNGCTTVTPPNFITFE